MKRVYLLAGILGTGLLCAPTGARASTKCIGTINGGVINGAAVVPPGQSCVLNGTTINGDISVQPGGSLLALGAKINGDVSAVHATFVEIQQNSVVTGDLVSNFSTLVGLRYGSTVNGSFQVKNGTGSDSGRWGIDSATVGGDVKSDGSEGTCGLYNARIGGNINVAKHTGRLVLWVSVVTGTVTIQDSVMIPLPPNPGYIGLYMNTIRGSVIYTNNSGAFPITYNVVQGNMVCTNNDPGTIVSQNTISGTLSLN